MLDLIDFDQKISTQYYNKWNLSFFVLMRCDQYVHGYIDVDPDVDIDVNVKADVDVDVVLDVYVAFG